MRTRKRPYLKIGAVLAVPLVDSRYGYIHYIAQRDNRGPLIRVFDVISSQVLSTEDLQSVGYRFGPILANIAGGVEYNGWQIIGYMDTGDVKWPQFLSFHYDDVKKRVRTWFLRDETGDQLLGPELPMEYRNLERGAIFSPEHVERRIRTGDRQDAWWRASLE